MSHGKLSSSTEDISFDNLNLGQSGFVISPFRHGREVGVSKHALNEDGAARLYQQYLKHELAVNSGFMEPLIVPEIIRPFASMGYSMSYVPGQPLGFAFQIMSQSEVRRVAGKLTDYFEASISTSGDMVVNNQAIAKIQSLASTYENVADRSARSVGLEVIEKLSREFSRTELRSSTNHGDFSLENLLIDRRAERLFAIDFLDSPFESCLIDIGRLWLDLSTRWWATRSAPSATAWTNLALLRATMLPRLNAMGVSTHDLNLFSAFAALRVLPYTKVPYRSAILKSALRKANETL